MAVILKFSIESTTPAQPVERGHQCLIIPFPRLGRPLMETAPEKPLKNNRQPNAGKPKGKRGVLISKVKIAQKQLGLCDADYRELLQLNFGVSSCTELDDTGLVRLISYFRSKGWQDKPVKTRDRHGKPKSMKDASNPITPTLSRIEALLTNLGAARGRYVPWDYAAAILKKHTGLDCLDTATVSELQKIMIALERTLQYEQRKQACSQ
jgi:phage gp16-like protein